MACWSIDVDGDGQVTQRNEVVFTDWDATATNDMQALAHVFDTDNDGSLDAGDDQFASFKVLVTNADGTTTLKTLAEAGITSINLIPDATRIVLPDGSTIDGQTTFTRSGGGTGTAAAVTLMADMAGYVLEQTVTHNGDGSTTIDSTALNPDGSVAYEIIGVTSADGNTRTLSVDGDGDGVIDQVQTIATRDQRRRLDHRDADQPQRRGRAARPDGHHDQRRPQDHQHRPRCRPATASTTRPRRASRPPTAARRSRSPTSIPTARSRARPPAPPAPTA